MKTAEAIKNLIQFCMIVLLSFTRSTDKFSLVNPHYICVKIDFPASLKYRKQKTIRQSRPIERRFNFVIGCRWAYKLSSFVWTERKKVNFGDKLRVIREKPRKSIDN